jgi:hypothetical protein
MGCVKFEFATLMHNRKMVLSFLGLLILNAFLLVIYIDSGDVSATSYKDIKSQIISGDMNIYDVYNDNQDFPEYTAIYNEYDQAESYGDYIDRVLTDAEENQSISTFQTKFSINNLKKTEKDYSKLKGNDVRFVGGYGLANVTGYGGTAIIVILFTFVLVMETLLRDKKNGLLNLYKTTVNGEKKLIISKFISGMIFLALFVVFTYATNLAICRMKYGAVDMSAPIQSVYEYGGFGYRWSIGEFVVLNLLCKILIYVALLAVMFFFAMISSNEAVMVMWTLVFFLISFLVKSVGSVAGTSLLSRASVLSMLNSEKFFKYVNYNMFNNAVTGMVTDVIIYIALIIVGVAATRYRYKNSSCDYSEGVLAGMLQKIPFLRKGGRQMNGSLWSLEGYKLWAGYKLIFMAVLLLIVQGYIFSHKTIHWGLTEKVYKYYTEKIAGDVTQEKLDYIDSEEERYEDLQKQADELEEANEKGELSYTDYLKKSEKIYQELQNRDGFEKCRSYVQYIVDSMDKGNSAGDESGMSNDNATNSSGNRLGFVYDRGWNCLIGDGANSADLLDAIKLSFVVFIVTAFLWFEDYRYRIDGLLETTRNYKKLMVLKGLRTFLVALITYAIIYVPELVWTYKKVGLAGIKYDVRSLMVMGDLNVNVSILEYMILVNFIRFVGIILLLGMFVLLGMKIKNSRVSIILAIILVAFPLILAYMDVSGFLKYEVVKILAGNLVFEG